MSNNFQVYFIYINFSRKQTIKIHNKAKEFYYNATMFVFEFSIVYLRKKKWEPKNGPRLPTFPYRFIFYSLFTNFHLDLKFSTNI